MEIKINIPESIIEELNKHVTYHNVRSRFDEEEYEATIEDVILGALSLYLYWTGAEPLPLIKSNELIIESKYIELIKRQNRRQKEISELSGIPKSTLSTVLNGESVPSLETFIRIWIALGKPPIEHLLSIKTE